MMYSPNLVPSPLVEIAGPERQSLPLLCRLTRFREIGAWSALGETTYFPLMISPKGRYSGANNNHCENNAHAISFRHPDAPPMIR